MSAASTVQSATTRTIAHGPRRSGSGCRYRVIGARTPGGKIALPPPFIAAPRPIPLFSVVFMQAGNSAAPVGRAPAGHEDTSRACQTLDGGRRQPLCDGEEAAAPFVDESLLVGPCPALAELLDSGQLAGAAEPLGGRHGCDDELSDGIARGAPPAGLEVDELGI